MADFVDEMFQGQQPAPEPDAQPPEQPVEPQVEAPAEPEQPPAPEPAPAPAPEPAAPKSDERTVPLGAFLDQRDELRELRRFKVEREAQERQQQGRPNPLDDPDGFVAWQDQQLEARLTEQRFAMSDTLARQAHGAETVEAAVGWATQRASSDPSFAASYMRQQNPIDWIVQQHKRDALLADIGDPSKLDDWFSREAAKRGFVAPSAAPTAAPAAPQPAQKPAQPPRSLASAPGNGTVAKPDDARAAFLSIFDKRAG